MSDTMQISNVGKARFNDRIYMIGETEFRIKEYIQIQTTSFGERQFPKIFTGKESLSNLYLSIEPKTINSVFPGFNLI